MVQPVKWKGTKDPNTGVVIAELDLDRLTLTLEEQTASTDGDSTEITPEEHKRRGDAAGELFRDMKRAITEKLI